jgi:hypothetical protein
MFCGFPVIVATLPMLEAADHAGDARVRHRVAPARGLILEPPGTDEYALVRVMARRRRTAILIALVAAIALHAAWAAPVRAVNAVVAAACCAAHCARLAGAVCDHGCCPVTGSPDSPVIQRDGTPQHRTAVAPVAETVVPPVVPPLSRDHAIAWSEPATGDPPPLFLLTRTLRI